MIQEHFGKFTNNTKCQKIQCIAAFIKMCVGQFAFILWWSTVIICPLPGRLFNSYIRTDDIETANLKRIAEFRNSIHFRRKTQCAIYWA